jgi:hypothetical protein
MKKFRQIITWSCVLFILLSIAHHILFEPITVNSKYLPLLRAFVIGFFAVLFLFGYLQVEDKISDRYWRPLLWVTIGIVIFYPVTSVVLFLQPYLYEKEATLGPFKLYQLIPQVMSIFMYSCFTYAFYLCRKIN